MKRTTSKEPFLKVSLSLHTSHCGRYVALQPRIFAAKRKVSLPPHLWLTQSVAVSVAPRDSAKNVHFPSQHPISRTRLPHKSKPRIASSTGLHKSSHARPGVIIPSPSSIRWYHLNECNWRLFSGVTTLLVTSAFLVTASRPDFLEKMTFLNARNLIDIASQDLRRSECCDITLNSVLPSMNH